MLSVIVLDKIAKEQETKTKSGITTYTKISVQFKNNNKMKKQYVEQEKHRKPCPAKGVNIQINKELKQLNNKII